MNENIIEFDSVCASYPGRREAVLRDISFRIRKRELIGITGPNGGGKTTLIKLILGLHPIISGRIRRFDDNGAETTALKTGYMPQVNQLDRKFPISVREVISSGLASEKKLLSPFNSAQKERIEQVIEQMELKDIADTPIAALSGGQFQRALLGRAIVSQSKLLALDEPGSYLDKNFEEKFYRILQSIRTESAIILVTHNMQSIEGLIDRRFRVDGTIEEISDNGT